jgi:hypothetical protein
VPRWLPRKPDDDWSGEHNWADALRSETSTFIQYGVLILAFLVKGYLTS